MIFCSKPTGFGRFWQVVEKHKVNIFYTAPTALRALMKEGNDFVTKWDNKELLDFYVIHLGETGKNWQGRVTDFWK